LRAEPENFEIFAPIYRWLDEIKTSMSGYTAKAAQRLIFVPVMPPQSYFQGHCAWLGQGNWLVFLLSASFALNHPILDLYITISPFFWLYCPVNTVIFFNPRAAIIIKIQQSSN